MYVSFLLTVYAVYICVLEAHGKSTNTGCKLLYSVTITAVSYMQLLAALNFNKELNLKLAGKFLVCQCSEICTAMHHCSSSVRT